MALILLAGPKHSGKTSTGRELAKMLEVSFDDLDQLIEERTGQSIRELYKTGKELFQREETAALENLLQKKVFIEKSQKMVLALGGGVIDNPGAMAALEKELRKSEGHCIVYLEISAETAWQRIVSQGELPPFLEAETLLASKEKHLLLHERRARDYKKVAAHCLFAEEKNPRELAEEMCNLIL